MRRLTAGEVAALRAWQRRMIAVFVIMTCCLFAVLAFDLVIGFSRKAAWLSFLFLLVLCALGVGVQFSQRCPNCGRLLGFQSALLVPDKCGRCGVCFKENQRGKG